MYTHDIDYVIRTLGVGATYRGYRYLSYGIELCLTDEEYLLAISKQLYPEIARKYKTTVGSVERDIRTDYKSLLGKWLRSASVLLVPAITCPSNGR